MTVKKANYTPEETEKLLQLYAQYGSDDIEKIAELMEKTVRSVRSKLVKEGVYVAPTKPVKVREDGPSKKELIRKLCDLTGKELVGIEPATKSSLMELIAVMETR